VQSSDLLQWLSVALVRLGPGVLFAVCVLETAVFAGILLPVGALVAFSALLSARGVFDPADIVFVALTGAFVGDQLGYLMGRLFAFGNGSPRGRLGTLWSSATSRTERILRGRGALGISVSRMVPFVRTIMPWFVGRSGMGWGRFVLFDLLGVLLWGTLYVGGGFLAGEGWRQVAERFGEGAGAVLLLLLGVLAALGVRRGLSSFLRRRRSARSGV
jgi:membrane-associated protein